MAVVGQETELKHQQDQDRRNRQRYPRHTFQKPPEPAVALARGASENLREQRVWRAAGAGRRLLSGKIGARDRCVVGRRRPREQKYLHQHVGVQDHEQDRRQEEEAPQRQIDVEHGQLDRLEKPLLGGTRQAGEQLFVLFAPARRRLDARRVVALLGR